MDKTHIPRKRFGQHFLNDPAIIAKIVRTLHPKPGENLLEIGAGTGALTTSVLNHVKPLHVVEIDRDLCVRLRTAFPHEIILHEHDALKFDFASLGLENLRIFGNLPYNISTPLLFHLLSYAPLIQDMLFMLQKEVILRICAAPGHKDYGRLSVMIQYFCRPEILFDVPPACFNPPPKVMSSMIRLRPHAQLPYVAQIPALFSRVVATAFQHRRKTLKNALEPLLAPDLIAAFQIINIDPQRRPETLSIEEYVQLSNALSQQIPNPIL